MRTIVIRRSFPGTVESVREARRFVAAVLAESTADARTVEHLALLAVSELATNAVEHAGTGYEVGILVGAGRVHITVADGSAALPSLRQAGLHDEGGRGLALVDAVAERWGVADADDGKAVWCDLTVAPTLDSL